MKDFWLLILLFDTKNNKIKTRSGSKYLWYIEIWRLYNIKQTNNKILFKLISFAALNKIIDKAKIINNKVLFFVTNCDKW